MKLEIPLLMATVVPCGQLLNPAPPQYEVASIKPNADNDFRFAFQIRPDGSVTATGITLKRLMMTAFDVHGFNIVGAPDWVASRRWNLLAKHDGLASPDQIHQMLRTLLKERFQLRSHSEIREIAVYELVVDRKGAKVPTAKDAKSEPTVRAAPGSVELTNATSATFASQLSYALARPVIDKTGLSGNFDFSLRWTPEPGEDDGPTTVGLPPGVREQAPSTPDGPSIFAAVREQLGLRLKSGRGPVRVVVIDDVQMPTVN